MLRTALAATPDATPVPVSREILPRSFGPYELLEEIARGGMGVVYKARQRTLNRIIALKVLLGGAYSSESLVKRFQVEAEAAAALQHPGIVAIHEFGEHDDQPYYTMDYVEGQNLSQAANGKPLAPLRAAGYLQAIAEAVQFAHLHGILHRDLKPSNVLIDLNDRPRVADFGLAKRLHEQSEATIAGQMLGSPNYAPPEQVGPRREEVGVRSDVYSLGALLYNLLTGRPPFLAGTVHETLRLVLEDEPVAPRLLNPAVPRDLETICIKCLEKDPPRRYDSAQEVADELARFQRHEPILARPVSRPEQGIRWCRRHPAITALAATVVIALTSTSAIFYFSARRIEAARAQERAARLNAEEELYATSMLASSMALEAHEGMDPRDLRSRLEASRPKPGGSDQRGFEWRYFWSGSRGDAIAHLPGHHHVIDAVFYSPDGNALATYSRDRNLKIWDAHSLKEIVTLNDVACAGGFAAGSTRLIFSRANHSIWQWDASSPTPTQLAGPGGQMIAALPDGKHAVVFDTNLMPVMRALEGAASTQKGGEVSADTCAVVSANGRFAAVTGRTYPGILVVDLIARRTIATLVDPRPVIALALSPDGARLVSAGFDGICKVWDVSAGTLQTAFTFKSFTDPAWGLVFSPDGKSLAAGGHNRDIKVWDTATWTEKEKLRGHLSTVRCIAFSPDGRRLVSGSEDEEVLVWPAHPNRLPKEAARLLRGPAWIDRTPSLAFSPDSRLFAGTAADGTVKIWRTDSMASVSSFPMDARTVSFSADGASVLGEDYNGAIQRWPLHGGSSGGEALSLKAVFTDWQVDPLSSQERVNWVAAQAETRAQCRLCEIPSARDGINAGAMLTTPTIVMSSDARTMFVGLPQGTVEVWDVRSQKRRFEFSAHKLGITALAVSLDGQFLATGSLDNSTKLWDTATGHYITTYYAHNRPVWALAFSPDGKTLASGSCDKGIVLCSTNLLRHVASLHTYMSTPGNYEQEVRLLRFSPDGNILAAALGDGTVRFFRAAPFSETDAIAAPNPSL